MSNLIPSKLYEKIVENIPIVCVDVVIRNHINNKILLIKRKDEPCKNEWWIVGGRLHKNEMFSDCAIRKAREEVGLECKELGRLDVANTMFSTGYHNIPVHSVNIIYYLETINHTKVKIDGTCLGYKWINPSRYSKMKLNHYVRMCLKLVA